MPTPSGTSGSRLGSRGWRAAFRSFRRPAGKEVLLDNAKALVEHHDPVPPGRWCSTPACTPLRGTGMCDPWPVRRTGPAPRARTNAGLATSSAMPSRAGASPAGRRWRRTWRGGCARSPTTRVHGTTGEAPAMLRFDARGALQALRPLGGKPPFRQMRELTPLRAERRLRGRRHQPLQRALAR